MKTRIIKLGTLLLAVLMLMSAFVACNNSNNPDESKSETESKGEVETTDAKDAELSAALEELGDIDYGGKTLTILCSPEQEVEVKGINEIIDADGGSAQVLNDAVYDRNEALAKLANLKVVSLKVEESKIEDKVRNESMAPMHEFQFIDTRILYTTGFATNTFLADWEEFGVDLDNFWWDKGTADFRLAGGVYFMCGAPNFGDDLLTYAIIFNKDMREDYKNTIANPYDTVRASKWTLDYFYGIIQGVSRDSAAPSGEWDANDTYGFVTNSEAGNTFFLASELRYIVSDDSVDLPELYLSDATRMEKALNVLDLAKSICHDNNATFLVPGGEEPLGTTAFKENRALFFGEAVTYLQQFNRDMKGDYGLLPVPKYDEAQADYRTWTHANGSCISIISTVPDSEKETVGKIMSAYAILSQRHVQPAFYDTVLTGRSLRDPDSAEMMDQIFSNRIYDMAFYFVDFKLSNVFKNCVINDSDTFSSDYTSAVGRNNRTFNNTVDRLFKKLSK